MKKASFFLIFVTIIGYTSCNKEKIESDPVLLSFESWKIPGHNLVDMAIDNNHAFYFISGSNTHYAGCLSRRVDETGEFELLDDNFSGGAKLCFDKQNHLWSFTPRTISKFDENFYQQVIVLLDDKPELSGPFRFITVDNNNNIWAGGLQTGLYKIDGQLNITHYNGDNSILPTNSMTAIHVDKNNTIWIALWDNQGVLKISNERWTIFNSDNSNLTNQNIICLVTDKSGHLWIGTGFDNEDQSLMRFDGTQWETVNPRNDKNEVVKGMVQYLLSDDNRIYALSVQVNKFPDGSGAQSVSNELLSFDGRRWNEVRKIPKEGNFILVSGFTIDFYRSAVWIWNSGSGILKMPFSDE